MGTFLKPRGYRKIVEVNFGEKAMDSNKYDSAASEMWMTFPLSEAGIPNDDELLQQLSDRRYSYNNKTQKVVEKKRIIKKDIAENLRIKPIVCYCVSMKNIHHKLCYINIKECKNEKIKKQR